MFQGSCGCVVGGSVIGSAYAYMFVWALHLTRALNTERQTNKQTHTHRIIYDDERKRAYYLSRNVRAIIRAD